MADPCVCGHQAEDHEDEREACDQSDCGCPWFCTEADADEIIGAAYEDALLDGKAWAEESHEFRSAAAKEG